MQLLFLKENKKNLLKGDCIEVRASSSPFTEKEQAAFVLVEVPDLPMADYEQYMKPWERVIECVIENADMSTDSYQLNLTSPLFDSANNGIITNAEVQAFIENWNGSVNSFEDNSVIFDITIFDALKSKNFWDMAVDNVVFTETNYDSSTGIHTVQVDYSAYSNVLPTTVERIIRSKGATIVSHQDYVITIEIARLNVSDAFQEDIQDKSRVIIAPRRYYIAENIVNYIINQGGTVTTDEATLLSYLQDKVSE